MATLCPNADGSSPQQREFDEAPPMCIDPEKTYTATMVTSMGTMVIHLNAAQAPKTVNNFVTLARYHYYDGIIFHRIINGFMCQGGDPTGTGRGGPGYRFEDELPAPGRYEIGSIAMANAGPNTNGSQFFITVRPTSFLNNKHTVFGRVIEGLDVVRALQQIDPEKPDPSVTADRILEAVVTRTGLKPVEEYLPAKVN